MPSITVNDLNYPSIIYSFDTEDIKDTDVEYSHSSRVVEGGEHVEETHTMYLKDGSKAVLMTLKDDEAEEGADKYIYSFEVYSEEELKDQDDPGVSLWISKHSATILKGLCTV